MQKKPFQKCITQTIWIAEEKYFSDLCKLGKFVAAKLDYVYL